MFTLLSVKKLAVIVLFAATLGGCQTVRTGTVLETDGSCVIRKVPVVDSVTGELFERAERFCGGKTRIVQ